MGGDAAAVERLDHLFAAPAEAQTRATFFGVAYRLDQWAPGNEHDLGAPFLYAFARQPWKVAGRAARRPAGSTGRRSTACPATTTSAACRPGTCSRRSAFAVHARRAAVHGRLADVRPRVDRDRRAGAFTIEAPGASLARKYVQSATLNGRPLDRAWFADDALRPGGSLRLRDGRRRQPLVGGGGGGRAAVRVGRPARSLRLLLGRGAPAAGA